MPLESQLWAKVGYPSYSVVHDDRSYAKFGYPAELPGMRNTASIEGSLQVLGAAMVSLGHGNGSFTPLKFKSSDARDYRGNVYVANVGQSIIPNYPLAGALVGNKYQGRGAGAMLVKSCVEEARSIGLKRIFTLTYVPDFFLKLGFDKVDKAKLPHKVWADCLKCPKFPLCDETALLLSLVTD